jgi:hypothetical protein
MSRDSVLTRGRRIRGLRDYPLRSEKSAETLLTLETPATAHLNKREESHGKE